MKILHINTNDSGGAFQAAYRLHKALLAANITSDMLVLNQSLQLENVHGYLSERNLYQKIIDSANYRLLSKKNNVRLQSLPIAQFSFTESPYDITNHPLIKSADIINFHWISNFVDYTSFFKKINKPVVWTLHDMNPFIGGFHYKSYELQVYKQLNTEVLNKKKHIYHSTENLTIVSPSYWIQNEAKKSDIFQNFIQHHISNSLDITIFKPYPKDEVRKYFNLPQNKKIILFVADNILDERKGLKYILEAIKLLAGKNIILLTVGNNSVQYQDVAHHKLGFLTDETTIAKAYSAADVFVIGSIEDNLPNTVLEAMSCGIPIVGFDIGGISDMVREGDNGSLATPNNVADFALKISNILENDELRQNMAQRCRAIAIQEYSHCIQANRYIELYTSLLK